MKVFFRKCIDRIQDFIAIGWGKWWFSIYLFDAIDIEFSNNKYRPIDVGWMRPNTGLSDLKRIVDVMLGSLRSRKS